MAQPQQIDPCRGIEERIDETKERIKDDRQELQHPEDLTPEQKREIEQDLEDAEKELKALDGELKRCRHEHEHL
jgi:predicted  nucleic acid-binding Zn-ribbon protein